MSIDAKSEGSSAAAERVTAEHVSDVDVFDPFSGRSSEIDEEIVEMESEIQELIRRDNGCSSHLRYSPQGSKVLVKLVTFNPKHKSTFLVHSAEKATRKEAVMELLDYVKKRVSCEEKCYSVTWRLRDTLLSPRTEAAKSVSALTEGADGGLVTSHFYAQDIFALLDKFFYDKNKDSFEIIAIQLNPTA